MLTEFDPVLCSHTDNEFLLAHLGEPTIVALRSLPPGATRATVQPILERVNELQALEQADGFVWCGVAALKQAIETWKTVNAKWRHDHENRRSAPRWPSLYSYDAKGKPHLGGPGSDSGRVRSYFGPGGVRIPFAVPFIPDTALPWDGPVGTEGNMPKLLVDNGESNRLECRIRKGNGDLCGHTESYKPSSRASFNAARMRMSKHLRRATEETAAHRELHTQEFGAPTPV